MRLASVVPFLLLSVVSSLRAHEPFESLSYSEALLKAKNEKKVVMIDFFAASCPPSKALDQTTWKDKKVLDWLDERAVCLKVDVENSPELFEKFTVRGFPTIIFVRPDGVVTQRLLGYVSPEDFLEAAAPALSTDDPLDLARRVFEANGRDDPYYRLEYAQILLHFGRRPDALEHFLWCWDHGAVRDPTFESVRTSFVLENLVEYARSVPSALEALRTRRAEAERKVRAYVAGEKFDHNPNNRKTGLNGFMARLTSDDLHPVVIAASSLAALNDAFGDKRKTIAVYDELVDCDREYNFEIRRAMIPRISRSLFKDRRYSDLVRDDNPVGDTQAAVLQYMMLKARAEAGDREITEVALTRAKNDAIHTAGLNYESCIGAKRDDLADQVKAAIFEAGPSLYAYETLILHAAKAKRYDVVVALGDEAKSKLNAKDADTIAKRVKANLSTPTAKADLEKQKQ